MEKGKGLKVSGFLLSHKPDVVMVGEGLERKCPCLAFAGPGVETVKTEAGSLRDVEGEMGGE
jgi:hypothetical protein